jgi:SAM-dependent methyltransferase
VTRDEKSPPVPGAESGAHIARVYNALLGGKDNYEVDREIRDQLTAVAPGFSALVWDIHQFLIRASRFLAGEAGINQFLDFGASLPIAESMHEVVQRFGRDVSVVYVGMDPLILAHGRALLADNDNTHIVDIDWRTPHDVIGDQTVRKYIDFEQPVAICQVGTLMHVADEYDPWRIMRELIDACAPNSYFAFAHLLDPGPGHELADLAACLQEVYLASAMASGWFRTIDRINDMLSGLELVEPGMVPLAEWWPDGPRLQPLNPVQRLLVGAVGWKP